METVVVDGKPAGDERRRNLEEQKREADGDPECKGELPLAELSLHVAFFGVLVLSGVVRGDSESSKADRQGLAESHDPAKDRNPEPAMLEQRRRDRAVHLGDLAVRLSDSHGPGSRAAHHDTLQDSLAADRGAHGLSPQVTLGASGLFEPALEALDAAARIHELLLARVKGVALRADLDVQLRLRGACLELVTAGAANGRDDVLGMNVSLHLRSG
jgi:hypothetical protein